MLGNNKSLKSLNSLPSPLRKWWWWWWSKGRIHMDTYYATACQCWSFSFSIAEDRLSSCCPCAGHALEAGWFLLEYAQERGDVQLQKTAVDKFMEVPFLSGWDKEFGGLFYFLDVDGHCPTQVRGHIMFKILFESTLQVSCVLVPAPSK